MIGGALGNTCIGTLITLLRLLEVSTARTQTVKGHACWPSPP